MLTFLLAPLPERVARAFYKKTEHRKQKQKTENGKLETEEKKENQKLKENASRRTNTTSGKGCQGTALQLLWLSRSRANK